MTTGKNVHIGQIGGVSTPIAVAFARPANTTAYTAKDAICTALAISDSTNASPIVITCTAHGLADGDPVTIAGITGNTNANGDYYAKVTGYSATTFALYTDKALTTPRAGNGAHGGTGLVHRLFRLKNIFRTAGGSGYITKVRVITDLSTWVDRLKLHFYSTPISAIADNAVFTLLWANRAARLGAATMPAMATEGTGSDSAAALAIPSDGSGLILFVQNNDASQDLYFRIEDLDSGTPASAQNFYIEVTLESN